MAEVASILVELAAMLGLGTLMLEVASILVELAAMLELGTMMAEVASILVELAAMLELGEMVSIIDVGTIMPEVAATDAPGTIVETTLEL